MCSIYKPCAPSPAPVRGGAPVCRPTPVGAPVCHPTPAQFSCSIYKLGADPLCGYDHPIAGPKFRKQAEALLPVVQASDILFPSAYLMSVDPRSHGYILGLSGLECDLNHWAGPPCANHSLAVQRAGLRSIIGQALRASAAVERKPPVIPFIWQFCSVCNSYSMNTNCAPCY